MFNAATKQSLIILAVALLSSCAGKSPETIEAESLLAQAETAIADGNPSLSTVLLDSLQKTYPSQLEVQRAALAIRPKAIEAATIAEIQTVDSLMACLSVDNEKTAPAMKLINDKELVEPYYVPAAVYNPNFLNTTGIQPRVNEIGQFYIISSVNGNPIRHESITLSCNGGSVTAGPVACDGELNFRQGGSEMITYQPEQCDTLGQFVCNNLPATITLTINGANGKRVTSRLTDKQARAIADAYRYSQSIVNSRELAVKRQKLDRQLQIARDQMARQTK